MHWLIAVLAGHLLTAVSFVLSKVLLSKDFNNPYVFAFYVGVLGMVSVALIPFGFAVPEISTILFDLLAGGLFTGALICFFIALQGGETSRIVPLIGAGIPIFTLIFEWLLLDEQLGSTQLIAFAILVTGSVIINLEKSDKINKSQHRTKLYGTAVLAALLFAVSFGMTKIVYDGQPFISGFVWMRFGTLGAALLILFSAKHRTEIRQTIGLFKKKAGILYVGAQAFGGVGFVLINYAINLASVSIVNALQGVQYVFLILLVVVGSIKYPKLLKENLGKSSLAVKLLGVVVISFGIYLIAQSSLG